MHARVGDSALGLDGEWHVQGEPDIAALEALLFARDATSLMRVQHGGTIEVRAIGVSAGEVFREWLASMRVHDGS
jgi:hypothetical protein